MAPDTPDSPAVELTYPEMLEFKINEGVTTLITRGVSEKEARELLSCLKFIIELERIGDLLLNVANRFQSSASRLDPKDKGDLVTMSSILVGMLAAVQDAFTARD